MFYRQLIGLLCLALGSSHICALDPNGQCMAKSVLHSRFSSGCQTRAIAGGHKGQHCGGRPSLVTYYCHSPVYHESIRRIYIVCNG